MWGSIDTAPKDGTKFEARQRGDHDGVGEREGETWWVQRDGYGYWAGACWRPLEWRPTGMDAARSEQQSCHPIRA